MFRSDLFKTLLVVFSATTCTALVNQKVVPYSDGSCTKPLSNFTYDDYKPWAPSFNLGAGVSGDPGNSYYSNIQFNGAKAPNNQAGYGVYWDTGPIDSGCRVIFMKPTVEDQYGQLSADQPPGNVILNVGTQGCYYTSLGVSYHSLRR